jgi:hypothetical protein
MQKTCFTSLAIAGALFVSNSMHAQTATSVISFTQGSGANPAYNNPDRAIGLPTVYIGYQDADPFNPPYHADHLVGLGVGGSLVLQFATPILNAGGNPFGLDFIVFGHAGFAITNGDFDGGGITDGSFFTGGAGDVRVSVSADGSTFYTLDPLLAPGIDGLFPTDASGNPFLPANPALTAADFAGQNLAGIRALYAGSAGGAGFDLSWAIDGGNQSVPLSSVGFVRFDVLSGTAYLDAVTLVPEPATWTLGLIGCCLFWMRRRKNAITP